MFLGQWEKNILEQVMWGNPGIGWWHQRHPSAEVGADGVGFCVTRQIFGALLFSNPTASRHFEERHLHDGSFYICASCPASPSTAQAALVTYGQHLVHTVPVRNCNRSKAKLLVYSISLPSLCISVVAPTHLLTEIWEAASIALCLAIHIQSLHNSHRLK